MEALWERSPASSEDLFALIGEAQGWQYPTLRTLVNRLLTKGGDRSDQGGAAQRLQAGLVTRRLG